MKRSRAEPIERQEAGRAALAAAAVLTEPMELSLLAAMGVATETLEALFDGGFLVAAPSASARLSSMMDREALLGSIAWSARRKLHERAAVLLAARSGRTAEAAQHYLAACCYGEARALLIREAERACADKEYDRALEWIDQCLAVWPVDDDPGLRLRILGELVRCARNCGRHDVAKRALLESLEMPEGRAAGPAMETHQQLADLALLEGDFSDARRHLETAATIAGEAGQPEEAARRWFSLATFLADQVRPREALTTLQRARKLAGAAPDPALLSEMLGWEGLLLAMTGRADGARARVEESLAVAVQHQLPRQAALAYRRMANIREYGSDYGGERDAHLHVIALCRRENDGESAQSCLTCLSYVFFRTGEWKRALATARDVARQEDAHPAYKSGALGVQAMVAAFRGEQRRTLAILDEASHGLRRHGVLSLEFHLLWARAFLQESAGDHAGAAADYSRLLEWWDDTEDSHDILPGAVSAAAFFADAGDSRKVARITDILHAVVAINDNEESRAARFAVLAESAAGGGDLATAVSHFTSARDGYDRLGTPVERALIRRRLARALLNTGRDREAATELGACAAIARGLGMRSILATIHDSPQPRRSSGAAAILTARQQDVLRLLAAGLTNKEAADRLHLSPRTVEMHVASLLDRLNCRTRTAAMRRAAQLKLLD